MNNLEIAKYVKNALEYLEETGATELFRKEYILKKFLNHKEVLFPDDSEEFWAWIDQYKEVKNESE